MITAKSIVLAIILVTVKALAPCEVPSHTEMETIYNKEISKKGEDGAFLDAIRVIPPLVKLDLVKGVLADKTACRQDLDTACGGDGQPPCAESCDDFGGNYDGAAALCAGSLNPEDPQLEKRSFCPWSYRMTTDERRYPKMLTEASCCSSVCLVSTADCLCEEIVRHIPVLMYMRNSTNHCSYQMTSFPLPVGCTATERYVPGGTTPGK